MCSHKLPLDDEKLRSPSMAALPGNPAIGPKSPVRLHVFSIAPESPVHSVLSSPQFAVRQGVDPDSFRSVRHCFSSSSQTRFLHNSVLVNCGLGVKQVTDGAGALHKFDLELV